MNELPKLSEENQKILNTLAELINYTKEELVKKTIVKSELSPKQYYVLSAFAAINSYTEAIFELCKQSRPDAAIVILRSISETWINSHYILGSPNNNPLYHYVIEGSYYKVTVVNELQSVYSKYPHLRPSTFPDSILDKMRELPLKELEKYKDSLNISYENKDEFRKVWGSLYDRASRVDKRLKKRQKTKNGGVEHMYTLVYRYLSEYTHLPITGLQHFWVKDTAGEESLLLDKNPDRIDLVLATAFTFYLYFATRLKQYKILNCSFKTYNKFFVEDIAKERKSKKK